LKLPKNGLQKLFCIVGIILFFFGIWQMDMICVGPVWSKTWTSPQGGYYNEFFEVGAIGPWKLDTTVGIAYDLMQTFMVLGLGVAIASLWFWDE
jgi:hypothetical protein